MLAQQQQPPMAGQTAAAYDPNGTYAATSQTRPAAGYNAQQTGTEVGYPPAGEICASIITYMLMLCKCTGQCTCIIFDL